MDHKLKEHPQEYGQPLDKRHLHYEYLQSQFVQMELPNHLTLTAIVCGAQLLHCIGEPFANLHLLRLSIDTKAKVKIGNLSQGGKALTLEAKQTDDHHTE